MESSQQLQLQKEPQSIIMLPSRHVPQQLISQIADVKDFSVRFINGYRNILEVSAQSQLEWALIQNEEYCGQAFCYLLKPTINKQELVKKQIVTNHVIHFVSQEMFVFQSVSGFTPNNLTITQQQLNKLIEQVAESKKCQKVAINLVKNAFQSYEAYNKAVGQVIQKLQKKIESQMQEKIPTVGQALSLEENVKKINGEMIGRLPKCNKETGQWDEGETIDIKLSLE